MSPGARVAFEQVCGLVDSGGQAAPAQRRRDRPRILALAGEQAGDTGGPRSYLESERPKIRAPVDTERRDFAALAAFAIDDRDVIALEDRDEEGTAAAYPVPLRARLEGQQARLANPRETRHVRGVVHGGNLR